jgi:hypothetical protein
LAKMGADIGVTTENTGPPFAKASLYCPVIKGTVAATGC